MKKIRVGSRESKLAVIQTQIVMDAIKRANPEIEVELVTMKTTGDIILDKTLDKIGGKGLFVKELDKAMLDGGVDITVHSFKDMPMDIPSELPIVATGRREDPRDVLVLPQGASEEIMTRGYMIPRLSARFGRAAAVAISAFVALTLTPMMSSKLVRPHTAPRGLGQRIQSLFRPRRFADVREQL